MNGGRVVAAIDAADLIAWAIGAVLFLMGGLAARYQGFRRFVVRSFAVLGRLVIKLLLFLLALGPGWFLYWLARLVSPTSLWPQVPVLVFLAGTVGLLFWGLSTDERRRRVFGLIGKVASGFVIPTVLAWTFLLAALGLFASLTFVMHESGAVQLGLAPGTGELRSGRLVDFYLWHFLDAIPLLRVTETLRWEQLVTYEGAGVGWLLLAFKLFVIIPVIGIFRSYWQYRKQRTEARDEPEGSPSAAVF